VISTVTLSRRDFLRLAGQSLAAMTLLAGCGTLPEDGKPQSTPVKGTPGTSPPPASAPQSPAQEVTSAHLDFKIGQMLLVGFRGLEVDGEHFIVGDIQERHLGGVVLFDYDFPTRRPVRNVASPSQVKALIASLQSASATPLLVAIDQEGGIVTRLKERHGFPPTVSHQHLGELNNLETTHEQAMLLAGTLADLGINLNLAPVVDLCVNPHNPIIAKYERCFSADAQVVTDHALQFIQAHHEQGVLCTLKHFPGHGSSTADSHRGLTDVTETWSRDELEPYARIIQAGQADAIMTAHVYNAGLDDQYPATLSQSTVTGILREELNYEGVVISDDMQMGAIARYYGFETAIQKAIEAGVDILAFANNSVYEEDVTARAKEVIRELVQVGTISEARIEASYRRIQRFKSRFLAGSPSQADVDAVKASIEDEPGGWGAPLVQ
jgi:beta-N-acetylhexosaminidase